MTLPDFAKFNHVDNIHQKFSISQIESNLKGFLDWSFLQADGYVNISRASGVPSGMYTLKPCPSPTQLTPSNSTKCWEGPVKDWVWEKNTPNAPTELLGLNGIYLNNTFLPAPNGSGNYSYSINYPLGQIAFNQPVSINSKIQLDYSYRYLQIYKSEDAAWWKELEKATYYSTELNYSHLLSAHRVQPPFIMIELIARNNQEAYELGNTKNMITQDVLLHIFTENIVQRNTISDILLTQKDKTIILYDINKVVKNAKYGIKYDGQKNPLGMNYSQIVSDPEYQYKISYIKSADIVEMNNFTTTLYNSVVRWSLKIFP